MHLAQAFNQQGSDGVNENEKTVAAGTPAAGPLAAFTGRLPTLLPHLTAHLW